METATLPQSPVTATTGSILPADYATLTREGQRLARVHAAALGGTPEREALGWQWFCQYYLWPDDEAGFDPGFYAKPLYPIAPLHVQMVRWLYSGQYVLVAAPRGSAKTTTLTSEFLRYALTRAARTLRYYRSTFSFAKFSGGVIKNQLEENPRIREDFGEQKQRRNTKAWSAEHLWLPNNSQILMGSLEGAKRGARFHLGVIDDPENDDDLRTNPERVIEKLSTNLRQVVMPMMSEDGRLGYLGTMISRKSFLYHVYNSGRDGSTDNHYASVQDGGHWLKMLVPARDNSGRRAWSKFSDEFLERQRRTMGDSAFAAEFLNDPRSDEDCILKIGPTTEYAVRGVGGAPLTAQTVQGEQNEREQVSFLKCSPHGAPIPTTLGKRQWLSTLYRGITVDYAPGQSAEADYSAAVVWGLDGDGVLWVLDACYGKLPVGQLAKEVQELARRWAVQLVANENVAIQQELIFQITNQQDEFFREHGWKPVYYNVRYPANMSKADRIAALESRFVNGMVKLPSHLRWADKANSRWGPGVRELYAQIAAFTPNLQNLRHDDLVDAFAMAQWATRGRTGPRAMAAQSEHVVDRIIRGETHDPDTGIALALAVDWEHLDPKKRAALVAETRRAAAVKLRDEEDGVYPDYASSEYEAFL
jgi:predicted phage terminase large subunit-like protein